MIMYCVLCVSACFLLGFVLCVWLFFLWKSVVSHHPFPSAAIQAMDRRPLHVSRYLLSMCVFVRFCVYVLWCVLCVYGGVRVFSLGLVSGCAVSVVPFFESTFKNSPSVALCGDTSHGEKGVGHTAHHHHLQHTTEPAYVISHKQR
jgi:hypothetical protein